MVSKTAGNAPCDYLARRNDEKVYCTEILMEKKRERVMGKLLGVAACVSFLVAVAGNAVYIDGEVDSAL